MILQAVWDNTELAIAEIDSLDQDTIWEGIVEILDQLEGTPYEEIIGQMKILLHPDII